MWDFEFIADQNEVLTAGDMALHQVWLETGAIGKFSENSNWVFSLSVSPDGRRAASGGYALPLLHQLPGGEEIAGLEPKQSGYVGFSFSPDSRRLATAGGGSDATVRRTADARPAA
jgi:WD40 repeat protein